MKTYKFPTQGSFGQGDAWDGEFTFALSDRQAKRLEESARKESRYMCSMEDDPEIADIYEKVLKAAIKEDFKNLLNDKDFVREQREWYEDETGSKGHADSTVVRWYLSETSYDVMYPKELQLLGNEEE